MKKAGIMLIVKDGYILGISRRSNHFKFGLVGGQVEENETPEQAAIREVKEEVGIDVTKCIEIYVREEPPFEPDGEYFYTHCFYALEWTGEPISLEGMTVKWLTVSELTGDMGAFPEYNKETLANFRCNFKQYISQIDFK